MVFILGIRWGERGITSGKTHEKSYPQSYPQLVPAVVPPLIHTISTHRFIASPTLAYIIERVNEMDIWTVEAMQKCGGGFVQALAVLVNRADGENLKKIKATWPEYWERYEKLGIAMKTIEK